VANLKTNLAFGRLVSHLKKVKLKKGIFIKNLGINWWSFLLHLCYSFKNGLIF